MKRDKMYLGVMIILAVILIIMIATKILELNNPVVIVDYSRTFVQMRDAGKYDIVNIELITEQNFPLRKKQGRARVMIKTFVSLDEMRDQGFRPAFVEELFALGEQYPDLQKKFKILALGSPWQREDHTEYPCLGWVKDLKDTCASLSPPARGGDRTWAMSLPARESGINPLGSSGRFSFRREKENGI